MGAETQGAEEERGSGMSDIKRGLTWSGKWHIINPAASNERYDISMCGAYLYNAEKEKAVFRGGQMPRHLQRIIDGTAKSTGECKRCNKSVGSKSVEERLDEATVEIERMRNDLAAMREAFSQVRHASMCATIVDYAPESGCDCVKSAIPAWIDKVAGA